jgi:hypothetical protein
MTYAIASIPTSYGGVMFRSRLEARWAAFFDMASWKWEYEPIDLDGWLPDFRVVFPCNHSECTGKHTLLVEVKPYYSLDEFQGHKCTMFPYGRYVEKWLAEETTIPADASAAFGINPEITSWEMAHGSGGGVESVTGWVANWEMFWRAAGALVQWKPHKDKQAPLPEPTGRGGWG